MGKLLLINLFFIIGFCVNLNANDGIKENVNNPTQKNDAVSSTNPNIKKMDIVIPKSNEVLPQKNSLTPKSKDEGDQLEKSSSGSSKDEGDQISIDPPTQITDN